MKPVKYKKGTVSHLQKYLDNKFEQWGFADETLQERLLLLAEETGELINACRKANGMIIDHNRKMKNNIGEEAADVLQVLISVAITAGIDLEKEFLEKGKKIDKRNYKRVIKK